MTRESETSNKILILPMDKGAAILFWGQVGQRLKVALQIMGRKFYENTKKSTLYSKSLLIFVH